MKKMFFIVGMFVIVVACNKNQKNDNYVLDDNRIEESGYVFPQGTRFVENYNTNGDVENIDVYLPDGYTLFGVVDDEVVQLPPGGGRITCSCSGSGKCSPVKVGNRVGCEIDGCSRCTGSAIGRQTNSSWQKLNFFFIQHKTLSEEAYAHAELEDFFGCVPIYDPQEWIDLPFINSEDFRNPEVIKHIEWFDEWVKEEEMDRNTPTVGVLWKIQDKKAMVLLPYDVVNHVDGLLIVARPPAVSCSGRCKDGICTKSGTTIVTCTGCDSGCTLSY